jgi:hypothetical protein
MRYLLIALGVLFGACGSDRGAVTIAGQWGGVNAQVDATGSGATLQFKCGARGALGMPLVVDAEGRFDEAGTYDPVVVTGGPRAATFHGEVHGSQLSLSVAVEQTVLGPYELAKDQPARFDVCNF